MRKLRTLLLGPRTTGPLILLVFSILLVTLFRAEGVQLDRLSVLTATIAAFSAVILVFANQQGLEISQRLLEESIKQRELNTTPHVALWLDANPEQPVACELVVKNIGHGPAYGIELSFVTGSEAFSDPRYHSRRLVDHGVKFMAPGRELRNILAGMRYMPETSFRMAVRYYPTKDMLAADVIEEEFDLNPWEAVRSEFENEQTKALTEIARELKRKNDKNTTWRIVGESELDYYRRRLRELYRKWTGR